jgi:hypothetical protein|tara:strand:- start:14048 stop:14389 length:342 start_codon:yes stop_codon:yes gene_type:complete
MVALAARASIRNQCISGRRSHCPECAAQNTDCTANRVRCPGFRGINGILPARRVPSIYSTVLFISPGQQFSTARRRTHGNGGNTAGTVLLRTPKTYDQARNLRPRSAGKPTGF